MRFIRPKETGRRVGFHPVHCLRKGRDPADDFPAPVDLGEKAVGFVEEEIEAWIERRVAERNVAVA